MGQWVLRALKPKDAGNDLVLHNIKKSGQMADLPPYAANLVSQSHIWAVNRIVAGFAARGYSFQQIQTADQIADYERALTLFMAHKRAGLIEGTSDSNMKTLDFLEGLKEAVLTQNGAFIVPAGTFGIPHTGTMTASDDIFQWPPQDGSPPLPAGDFQDPTRW